MSLRAEKCLFPTVSTSDVLLGPSATDFNMSNKDIHIYECFIADPADVDQEENLPDCKEKAYPWMKEKLSVETLGSALFFDSISTRTEASTKSTRTLSKGLNRAKATEHQLCLPRTACSKKHCNTSSEWVLVSFLMKSLVPET